MSQVITVLWHASKIWSNVCRAQYTTSLYYIPHYLFIVRTCMCMIYMQQWDSSIPFVEYAISGQAIFQWSPGELPFGAATFPLGEGHRESGRVGAVVKSCCITTLNFFKDFFQVGSLPEFGNSRTLQDSKLPTDQVEDRKYQSRRNSPCGVHLTHHQETNKTDGGNARREHDAASLSGLSENGSLDLDSSNVWPLWWLESGLNANPYNFYTFLDIIHTWYAYTTKYFNVIHIFHSIFIFSQEVLEMI